MTLRALHWILSAVVLCAVACGGGGASNGNSNDNSNNDGPPTGDNTMSAQINGMAWIGTGLRASYTESTLFLSVSGFGSPTGVDDVHLVTMGVGMVTGPGTYSLAFLNVNGSSAIVSNSDGQGWDTFFAGGTGSIDVTTLSADRVAGTFSFEAVSASGDATGTVRVTDGQFDIPL